MEEKVVGRVPIHPCKRTGKEFVGFCERFWVGAIDTKARRGATKPSTPRNPCRPKQPLYSRTHQRNINGDAAVLFGKRWPSMDPRRQSYRFRRSQMAFGCFPRAAAPQ